MLHQLGYILCAAVFGFLAAHGLDYAWKRSAGLREGRRLQAIEEELKREPRQMRRAMARFRAMAQGKALGLPRQDYRHLLRDPKRRTEAPAPRRAESAR